jgi:hypothetical protein
MVQIGHDPNRFLYHGTLLQNLPSIREKGLLPQKGLWTESFHPHAAGLVYAVDDEHSSAAILAIAGHMVGAGLVQHTEKYSFDDFRNDLIGHGAVIRVKATTFRHRSWSSESGHPIGAEPGNWYSVEPVRAEMEMTGMEMLAWLKPHKQDFNLRYRDHMFLAVR